MDIKAYIESGILEAYALGTLSESDAEEVRGLVSQHKDLANELKNIEETLWQHTRNVAIDPPVALQDEIWSAIESQGVGTKKNAPIQFMAAKMIPVQRERTKLNSWKYIALAACLAGSIIVNFILWNKGNESRNTYAGLTQRLDSMQAQQNRMSKLVSDFNKANSMMADTGMQTIVMHTALPGHAMAATLYWDKAKGQAYVAMNALPAPPAGMQYQLWVIQSGKPVSMGMLPNYMSSTPAMQKVAMPVTAGDAFAISLEKEGGNPIPTTVYVMGRA